MLYRSGQTASLKVAWLHKHLTTWNGGTKHVLEVTRRLKSLCDLAVCTGDISPDLAELFDSSGVEIVTHPALMADDARRWREIPLNLWARRGSLRRLLDRFDVVIAVGSTNWVAAGLARRLVFLFFEPHATLYLTAFIRGLPLKTRVALRLAGPVFRGIDARAARRADSLLTISQFSADWGRRLYGRDSAVIYPGVDTSLFDRKSGPGEWARYENDDMIVHSSTGLRRQKGTEFAIKAIPLVLREHSKARLAIINSQPAPEEEGRLKEMCRSLGVEQRVDFLPPVEEEQLPYLYSLAKVVVQPSIEESFSLPIYEAAACGTPSVGFRSGSGSEDIVDGEMGRLVEIGDVEALASAIGEMLADNALRRRLGNRARERIEESFTWDRHAQQLHGLLEQVEAGHA